MLQLHYTLLNLDMHNILDPILSLFSKISVAPSLPAFLANSSLLNSMGSFAYDVISKSKSDGFIAPQILALSCLATTYHSAQLLRSEYHVSNFRKIYHSVIIIFYLYAIAHYDCDDLMLRSDLFSSPSALLQYKYLKIDYTLAFSMLHSADSLIWHRSINITWMEAATVMMISSITMIIMTVLEDNGEYSLEEWLQNMIECPTKRFLDAAGIKFADWFAGYNYYVFLEDAAKSARIAFTGISIVCYVANTNNIYNYTQHALYSILIPISISAQFSENSAAKEWTQIAVKTALLAYSFYVGNMSGHCAMLACCYFNTATLILMKNNDSLRDIAKELFFALPVIDIAKQVYDVCAGSGAEK